MVKTSEAQKRANRNYLSSDRNKDYTAYRQSVSTMRNLIDPVNSKNQRIYRSIIVNNDDRVEYFQDMNELFHLMAKNLGYQVFKIHKDDDSKGVDLITDNFTSSKDPYLELEAFVNKLGFRLVKK